MAENQNTRNPTTDNLLDIRVLGMRADLVELEIDGVVLGNFHDLDESLRPDEPIDMIGELLTIETARRLRDQLNQILGN